MIRQVRFKETSMNAAGNYVERQIFGFGKHPLAEAVDYPAAGVGAIPSASATSNKFRIIIDELLPGYNLEEIRCRGVVDDDAYDRVSPGTTPDDIAKCAAPGDVLKSSCPSTTHPVCMCKNDGGCGTVAKGEPVGVADQNEDGAADDTRFINGSVGIKCGTIDVPIKLDESYWNPSGDQNKPAMGGFDVLGPAIVLVADPLPTNIDCALAVADSIVDKQGERLCAPVDGDPANGCTPGDVSAFKFKVTPLRVFQPFADNAMNVPKANPIFVSVSAPVKPETVPLAVTITQNGNPFPATIELTGPSNMKITAAFAANTTYELHITTALTDTFGQALPQQFTRTFTTGA